MSRMLGRLVWRGQTWEDAPRSRGQQRAREKRTWRREAWDSGRAGMAQRR